MYNRNKSNEPSENCIIESFCLLTDFHVGVALYWGFALCVCVCMFVKREMHRPVVEFDGALYVIAFGTCPKHLLNTSTDITGNGG